MNRFKYPGLFDVSCKEEKTCMLTLWVFVGFFFGGGGGPKTLSDNHFLLPLHFRVHCKRVSKYIAVHFRGGTKNTTKIENT